MKAATSGELDGDLGRGSTGGSGFLFLFSILVFLYYSCILFFFFSHPAAHGVPGPGIRSEPP